MHKQVCLLCVYFFSLLLKYYTNNIMSYCTIEEAWGLSEPFANETIKPKRRKHKKKNMTKEHFKHCHKNIDNDENDENVKESFINSPSVYYQPHSQESSFTRSFEEERIPDAIDVSVGGAPYQELDETKQLNNEPTNTTYILPPQNEVLSSDEQQLNTVSGQSSQRIIVHEELEWMRNNMSHLSDKIERLTNSLEAKQQNTIHVQSSTQAYDTLVFVLVGVFVLVLVDICFRAGQRFNQ